MVGPVASFPLLPLPTELSSSSRSRPARGLEVRLGVLDAGAWARWVEPVLARVTPLSRDQEPLLVLAETLADRFDEARARHDLAASPASRAPIAVLGRAAEAVLLHVERAEDRGVPLSRRADEDVPLARTYRQLRAELLCALIEHSPALDALLGQPESPPPSLLSTPQLRTRRSRLLYWLVTALVPDFAGGSLVAPHVFMPVLLAAEGREPLLSLLRGRWAQWPGFRPDQALGLGGLVDRQLETTPLSDWALAPPERVERMARRLRAQLRRFVHLEWLRQSAPEVHSALLEAWQPSLDAALLGDYESVISSLPWDGRFEACWRYLSGERDAPPEVCPVPWISGIPAAVTGSGAAQARAVLGSLREVLTVLETAARQRAGLYVLFH